MFFIVWGKKHVVNKIGYIADFCHLCRKPEIFVFQKESLARHLYYLSVSSGELVGFTIKCKTCDSTFNANSDQYRTVEKDLLPLEQLITRTHPEIKESRKFLFQREQSLLQNPQSFSSDERLALINESFKIISPKIEKRFSGIQIDKYTGLAIIGAIVLIIFGSYLGNLIRPFGQDWLVHICFLIGICVILYAGYGSAERFMQSEVFPYLIPSLKPIKPTKDELKEVLNNLKLRGYKTGQRIQINDLKHVIQV